jgi:AraC-like DNA-binding protein
MYVSAFLLRGIADRLRSVGVSTEAVLEGTGLSSTLLQDAGARVPLDVVDRFIGRAMELTEDPGLGVTLAMDPPAGAHTLIYHLVLACGSVRQAITSVQGIASQVVEHIELRLVEEGEVARFVYRSALSLGATSRFAADFTLTFAHRLARSFHRSSHERPTHVSFRHARPSYASRYTEFFGCPVYFNALHSELVFRRELLDWGHYLGNETLKQSIEETASKMLSSRTQEERTSDRIRLFLRFQGDLDSVTAESIARKLAVSERSLRRKLQSEGVSLTQLVDGVRREIACEELSRREACIESTAQRVGFTDRAAFYRAFKRWTGETPLAYRTRCAL